MEKGTRLKELIELALKSGEPTLFFINKQGDEDSISLRREDADDEEVFVHVSEQAPTPNFQICTVVKERVLDSNGELLDVNDEPALAEAIQNAEDERIRFYSERAEVFGETAWPIGSRSA
jgi:hypothetical protein